MSQFEVHDEVLDVAIVGGGVSGVYSGWRLLEAAKAGAMPAQTICLFECSDRIGGRLMTVTPPGMPHIRCELGGMRYISSQTLVRSLVENKLKLQTKPFVVDEPENIAYLRGHRLRLSELTQPDRLPYKLTWAERARNPGDLLAYAVNQIIPGATTMNPYQWWQFVKTAKVDGHYLYNTGFWNLVSRAISEEAYLYARDAGGYDTPSLNWNAADSVPLNLGDFGPAVTYSALVNGYQEVPLTLHRQYVEAGGQCRMKWRLKSFDYDTSTDGSVVVMQFVNENDGSHHTVRARSLILAMPRRSLELIDQTGSVLGPQNADVHALIRSVTPIPLFKIFLCYPYPWWQAVGVKQGRSVTDLPVRQCYYWGTEGKQWGADQNNSNSVLLASYDDGYSVGYWSGYSRKSQQPMFMAKHNTYAASAPDHDEITPWKQHVPPEQMVAEAHRQLVQLHGVEYAPEPYSAAYMNWGDDPFGGGANFWNIHEKSWEVIPRIIKPKDNIPVYICGEAYSNGQGWVEGALQTAEMMLQTHFHLQIPDWISIA